jgi:hypothetical protein
MAIEIEDQDWPYLNKYKRKRSTRYHTNRRKQNCFLWVIP